MTHRWIDGYTYTCDSRLSPTNSQQLPPPNTLPSSTTTPLSVPLALIHVRCYVWCTRSKAWWIRYILHQNRNLSISDPSPSEIFSYHISVLRISLMIQSEGTLMFFINLIPFCVQTYVPFYTKHTSQCTYTYNHFYHLIMVYESK